MNMRAHKSKGIEEKKVGEKKKRKKFSKENLSSIGARTSKKNALTISKSNIIKSIIQKEKGTKRKWL